MADIMDGANSMPWYKMGEHPEGIKIEVSDIAPRDPFKYTYDLWSNGLSTDAFTISRTYKITMRSSVLGDGLWTYNLDTKGRAVNISYTGKHWRGREIPMPVHQIDNMFLSYPMYKPEIHRLIGGTWIKGKWVDYFDRRNLPYRLEIVSDQDIFYLIAMETLDQIANLLNNLSPEQVPEASRPLLAKLQSIHICTSGELKAEMDQFHAFLGVEGKLPVEPPELAFEHYHAIPLIVEDGCGGPCTFCSLYDRRIRVRALEDVRGQVDHMVDYLGEELDHFKLCTLLDGDALEVPQALLLQEMAYMREHFPMLDPQFAHVFSKAHTVCALSQDALIRLHEAGLRNVNMGLESGCDELLAQVKPGQNTADFTAAVDKLLAAGLGVSVNIIAGLGGQRYSQAHVAETIDYVHSLPTGVQVFFSPLTVEQDCRYIQQQKSFGVLSPQEVEAQCQAFMNAFPCSEYIFVPM